MKILFIVPYVPNLIRVRPYNLIRALSDKGHEVTLLTLWSNEEEKATIAPLSSICHVVHAQKMPTWRSALNSVGALCGRDPLQSVYSWNPALLDAVSDSNQFDVVHVEHLRGVRYALHFLQHSSLPVVWDSVDCISHLFRQAAAQSKSLRGSLLTRLDLGRTERYEGWLVKQFQRILVTSQVDKKALLALQDDPAREAAISILPNGVDLAYFKPNPAVEREPTTLVVTGKMSYHANVTMTLYLVQEIMPRIWAQRPDVKLYIVGKDPTNEIQELNHHPSVTVTGTVDDIRPYLQRATIAVAPVTYGAGIQNKVLEAMACGTPVVTTPQSASAIAATPNQAFAVAEGAEAFASQTLTLLEDPNRRQQMSQSALSFIQQHHNWAVIANNLEEIYCGIIN